MSISAPARLVHGGDPVRLGARQAFGRAGNSLAPENAIQPAAVGSIATVVRAELLVDPGLSRMGVACAPERRPRKSDPEMDPVPDWLGFFARFPGLFLDRVDRI